MLIKNRCEKCKFFKKHIFFGEKSVDNIGGTCQITNRTTKCISSNKIITFDLQKQCPLNMLNEYERLRECWDKLRSYIIKLESESQKLNYECQRFLLDIIFKMKNLEEGENQNGE